MHFFVRIFSEAADPSIEWHAWAKLGMQLI
jgi:hypothetical protein